MPTSVVILLWTLLLATQTLKAQTAVSTVAFSSETTSIFETSSVTAAPIVKLSSTAAQDTATRATASLDATVHSNSYFSVGQASNVSVTTVQLESTSTIATTSVKNSSTTTVLSMNSSTSFEPANSSSVPTGRPPKSTTAIATTSVKNFSTTTELLINSSTSFEPANSSSVPTGRPPESTSTIATTSVKNSSTTTELSMNSSTSFEPANSSSVPTGRPPKSTSSIPARNSSRTTEKSMDSSTTVAPSAKTSYTTVESINSTAKTASGGALHSTTPVVHLSSTSTAAQLTLAPATGIATTSSSICSPGYCKNGGQCSIVSRTAACDCSEGFGGSFCESFVRLYKVTFAANDEFGVPMAYNAAIYGADTLERKKLGFRLCEGVTKAVQSSPNSVFKLFNCTLIRCFSGSLIAELSLTATFQPNVTAVPKLETVTQTLKDGIYATKATFCNASGLVVDYVNLCNGSSSRCSPYGTCNSSEGVHVCACNTGYTDGNPAKAGTNCTQQCSKTICPGSNQFCQERPGQPVSCQCSLGFTGPLCTSLPLSRSSVGLIVGNSVLLIIAIAALVIYCVVRRKRRGSLSRWQPLDNEEGDSSAESFTRV